MEASWREKSSDSDSSYSSDDYYEGLSKQALHVDMPKQFDPSSAPRNGDEYLHHVIYERKNYCKDIVVSNIDCKKFAQNQTIHISQETEPHGETNPKLIPSKEWQQQKLEDFIHFRKFVESKINVIHSHNPFDETDFVNRIKSNPPNFSEMVKYSQSSRTRMLQIITKYLNSLTPDLDIEDNVGTWIFAILVLLEIPLSPDACHVIRNFARKCLDIRSQLKDSAEHQCVPLNFFICIVSNYFRQRDLGD